jgi:hypothetical protein
MVRPPDHSVLIDWPWRWGFLVVSSYEVTEVIFDYYGKHGQWTMFVRAVL